jgi:hypothetical protein
LIASKERLEFIKDILKIDNPIKKAALLVKLRQKALSIPLLPFRKRRQCHIDDHLWDGIFDHSITIFQHIQGMLAKPRVRK